MSLLKTILLFLALSISGLAAARAPEAIEDYPAVAVVGVNGRALSADEVRQVVQAAAAAKKWNVTGRTDGSMLASLSWNGDKHVIVVEITCSTGTYSLRYKDSSNMNYAVLNNKPSIHPYYNRFVRDLNELVRIEAMKL